MKEKYLNLGCGSRYHRDWINVDIVPASKEVIQCNILKALPYADNSMDVVYHSHVLEHIEKERALPFLKECYRVLKPGGIIRVVVPDLEQIAREYIRNLDLTVIGDPIAEKNYNWTMLELYDQTVRTKSGGAVKDFIVDKKNYNTEYLIGRWGEEINAVIQANSEVQKPGLFRTYIKKSIHFFGRLPLFVCSMFYPNLPDLYNEAKFRNSGEIHKWMYDRFSLSKLLQNSGFHQVTKKSAFESGIKDWEKYGLDVKENRIIKPDSLFIEAIK